LLFISRLTIMLLNPQEAAESGLPAEA